METITKERLNHLEKAERNVSSLLSNLRGPNGLQLYASMCDMIGCDAYCVMSRSSPNPIMKFDSENFYICDNCEICYCEDHHHGNIEFRTDLSYCLCKKCQ
jgi:hypothetical protein